MIRRLIILLLIVGCALAVTTEDIYDNSYALIIGINKYESIKRLNYAVKDAKFMKSVLMHDYNFKKENITLLINENATYSKIRSEFSKISKLADVNDRVLIYFAGHGQTMDLPGGGEKGYLLPYEVILDDLYLTGLPMDELKNIALISKAKHILYLIDACYGGMAAIGTRGLNPESTSNYIHKITKNPSRQVITAGGRDEEVIEKPEWGHSAFTKNIRTALKFGNADYNDDNVITANELYLYLKEKVTIDSQNLQTPQYNRMTSDEGEFVFFVPNTTYKSQNDTDRKLQELLKKIAELEANIKFLENQRQLGEY